MPIVQERPKVYSPGFDDANQHAGFDPLEMVRLSADTTETNLVIADQEEDHEEHIEYETGHLIVTERPKVYSLDIDDAGSDPLEIVRLSADKTFETNLHIAEPQESIEEDDSDTATNTAMPTDTNTMQQAENPVEAELYFEDKEHHSVFLRDAHNNIIHLTEDEFREENIVITNSQDSHPAHIDNILSNANVDSASLPTGRHSHFDANNHVCCIAGLMLIAILYLASRWRKARSMQTRSNDIESCLEKLDSDEEINVQRTSILDAWIGAGWRIQLEEKSCADAVKIEGDDDSTVNTLDSIELDEECGIVANDDDVFAPMYY